MAITIEENEKAAFLPGGQVNAGSRPYAKLEEQKKCCFGWSKTKIFCCTCCLLILAALVITVTVVCLMLFVFRVGDKSGEAKEWEEKLKGNTDEAAVPVSLAGTYVLVSYDENYRTYLETMGIPWYVVPIILASNEKFSITELGDDTVQILTETSIASRNMTFKFGDEFSMEYGKGMGIMWNVCTREAPNVMMCRSEERERNWKLESKMVISEEGVVNERTFINKNITAKKFYKRELEEAEENILKEEEEEEEEDAAIDGSGIGEWVDDGWGDDGDDW